MLLVLGCTAAGAWLTTRALDRAGAPTTIDGVVELAVLILGILVAVWLAGSSAIALVVLLGAATGRRLVVLERWLTRIAPTAIRRLAQVGIGAGVGVSLTFGGAAVAAEPPTNGTTTSTEVSASTTHGGVLDLRWQSAPTSDAGPTEAGETQADRTPTVPPPAAPTTTPSTPTTAPATQAARHTTAPGSPVDDTQTGARTAAAPTVHVGSVADRTDSASAPSTSSSVSRQHSDRRSGIRSGPTVVVLRGDTLWDIAAMRLGPEAGAGEIATAVERWHATNRGVVGEDPDVILPGQVLTAPR